MVEIPYSDAEMRPKVARHGAGAEEKWLLSICRPEVSIESVPKTELVPIKGFKARGAHTIIGQVHHEDKGHW